MTHGQELWAGPDVSRETRDRLGTLVETVIRWQPAINLISPGSVPDIWSRHVLDSAQLLNLAPPAAQRWADLGSGAGFPGLVCAICAQGAGRATDFHLVESDRRKAAFLNTAARATGVAVTVHPDRAESRPPLGADVVSARALAPLDRLLGLARRHLAPGGRAILPKGSAWRSEVAKALETWRFTYENHPSLTDPDSVILLVKDIEHA
ncbi:MAG: 16S rRNA (guanine(527)-N(7))-methyltransferase RsmG [Paracoccaceae bacterium]